MPKLASTPHHTPAPAPAPARDAAPPPAIPTEPGWLTGTALKAVSERAFATQRAKKAGDRAKGKTPPRRPARSPPAPTWTDPWEPDARREDWEWPELPTPPPLALRPTQNREVSLAALVQSVKIRMPKEGEYEFLPPVKNVIALDDNESMIPDEPWEYVSSIGGDDESRKVFSYAEIVSKSA
ncbi:hypothetical protein BC834DRAFT_965756 [Gloeopeniophorella convolvens]|nr:hypothetical protein BC834DRAFT_965756 [Gloeopeniophorella convolvens]